jgi:hypothetical protein
MIPANYAGTITITAESAEYQGLKISFTAPVARLANTLLAAGGSFYADGILWQVLSVSGSDVLIMTKYLPNTPNVTITAATTYAVYKGSPSQTAIDSWYASNVSTLRTYARQYQFANTTGNENNWSAPNDGWAANMNNNEAIASAGVANTGTVGVAFLPSVSEMNRYSSFMNGGSMSMLRTVSGGPPYSILRTPGRTAYPLCFIGSSSYVPFTTRFADMTLPNKIIIPFLWIRP